jgi:RNA polymerase sigma-70 factor, ECF subfamily
VVRTPALDPTAEAELLAELEHGDRDVVFEKVFRTMRARVFAVCLNVTANRSDAEDATQETFVSAYRALASFRGEARLSTWLFRIAIRAALRVRARRSTDEPITDELAAPRNPNPGEAREQREKLLAGLASLSTDHRIVLALFAVDGLSHREIAETLGVPEGTVWSRLHLARKRLAVLLAEHS